MAAEAIRTSEEQLDRAEFIAKLEKDMLEAAEALEFEKAARLRDRIKELKDTPQLEVTSPQKPLDAKDG